MYKLSRNYAELFKLLCSGQTLVGFVDFDRNDPTAPPVRDVTKIIRHAEFDILFGVRGTIYWSIHPSIREDEPDELKAFVAACEKTNLEWIKP